ncbi:unnamed protein product, partial [Polarella glacialis]
MMDKQTGRSRGFGFCTFTIAAQVQAVLDLVARGEQHLVDGKMVEVKLCEAKGSAPPASGSAPFASSSPLQQRSRQSAAPQWPGVPFGKGLGSAASTPGKIFVGGLPQSCLDDTLQLFSQQFGNVVECKVMMDTATGRSRGFGYVTFDSTQAVDLALANAANNMIEGKLVD